MDTREYIIDKAVSLFLTNSYEAVSISDISNAIGFTKGALYHHFKNKEELFKAVVDKCFVVQEIGFDVETGTLLEFTEACLNHAKQTLETIFSYTEGCEIINYMSLIADSFRHYPGFADQKIKFVIDETNKIKQIITRSIERGEIRSDIDTSLIAQSYFSNMLGMATPIIQNQSIEQVITNLKGQLDQMYLLLKKV
jgi:AcrR family transcriptional regulator